MLIQIFFLCCSSPKDFSFPLVLSDIPVSLDTSEVENVQVVIKAASL